MLEGKENIQSPGAAANKKDKSRQQHGMLGEVNSDLGKKSKNS